MLPFILANILLGRVGATATTSPDIHDKLISMNGSESDNDHATKTRDKLYFQNTDMIIS